MSVCVCTRVCVCVRGSVDYIAYNARSQLVVDRSVCVCVCASPHISAKEWRNVRRRGAFGGWVWGFMAAVQLHAAAAAAALVIESREWKMYGMCGCGWYLCYAIRDVHPPACPPPNEAPPPPVRCGLFVRWFMLMLSAQIVHFAGHIVHTYTHIGIVTSMPRARICIWFIKIPDALT